MALEKFEYPATGTVTNSFLPTRSPSYSNAGETMDEGIVPEQSSGKKEYRYEEGIRIQFFRRLYDNMANSEKTSYASFRDVVAGDKFKFTDKDGTAHTVTFAVFSREFTPRRGDRWMWEILMRKEL